MAQAADIIKRKANNTPHKLRQMVDRWRGIKVYYDLKPYLSQLKSINAREAEIAALDDAGLRAAFAACKAATAAGTPLASSLIDVFALAREAAKRTLEMRPYDVQIVGAIALFEGNIIEMETGEGKTLVAALAATLMSLAGEGVHVLTVNDYLAQRDATWMGQIFALLGIEVAAIQAPMLAPERQRAYAADITYLTAKEAGFDYLRDGLAYNADDCVLRSLHYAIVDEADSILIDEARIPLVIAGTSAGQKLDLSQVAALVRRMTPGEHFENDRDKRNVSLTEAGTKYVEQSLEIDDLHHSDGSQLAWLTAINQALHARTLLQRDIDYIVRDGCAELVDELTGRVVLDRQWPDGLQAALEAKEGITQSDEGEILGSITLQHFFRRYHQLAGMTATARASEQELREFYEVGVVVLPTHHPCIREDLPPRIYTHTEAKWRATSETITETHKSGRPILIGTSSIRESEELAAALIKKGLSCQVLNAKHDDREAEIIAEAGALGAITISTNMAGRGTDIRLGGKDEADYDAVVALGGLFVLGTTRHESSRIDQQLRGRAGRQGDPGTSEYIISLEDETMVRNGINDLLPASLRTHKIEPITHALAHQHTRWAQRTIEGQHFDMRLTLWRYTSFVEEQRCLIRDHRDELLHGHNAPDLWRTARPQRTQELRALCGEERAAQFERLVTISCIDRLWSGYLKTIAEIREHIHMVQLGNMSPLQEFLKLTAKAFSELQAQLDQESLTAFDAIELNAETIESKRLSIKGPSSTWTYMVDDNPYRDMLSLQSAASLALGIGAAIYSPLYIIVGIYHRWFKKKK